MHSLNVPGMISIVVLLLIAGPSFPYSMISGCNVEETPNVLDASSTYVIATTANSTDPYRDAAEALALFRGGTVIEFSVDDLPSLMEELKQMDARYVAVVVRPLEMDINFHRAFVMNSTTLDDDPFPDISWGYITGATPQDALSFVENIIRAEEEEAHLLPMKVSGYSASSLNWRTTYSNSFPKHVVDSQVHLYLEVNDTGSGRDFFLANVQDLSSSRMVTISGDGDPHMTWLFDGGNFDPDPPLWPYDPSKVEDPAHARMGLTPENLSAVDLFPAVVFAGTCHSGVPKRSLVEGDIAATFGSTGGAVRFYEMSDDFSFFNRIMRNNATGYFAPIGANHGYNSYFDQWNALRYHEPMGDIYKRSLDQVVMGFMGNRPNLRLFNEGESAHLPDIMPSGDFDPMDWPSAAAMLGGKANRAYYGDPLHDPFRNAHDPRLNLTDVRFDAIDDTNMDLNISYMRPASIDTWFPNWDMYHRGEDIFYEPIDLPPGYSDPITVSIVREEQPSLGAFHVLERFDGRTTLHVQAGLPEVSMYDVTYYNITIRLTRTQPPPPIRGISLSKGDLSGYALPGGSAFFELEVTNTGEDLDDIVPYYGDPAEGWSLDVQFDGTGMAPGQFRVFMVNVSAPTWGLAGSELTIPFTFTSEGDLSVFERIDITTMVSQVFDVRLSGQDTNASLVPLETAVLEFEVLNGGNGEDDVILLCNDHSGWIVECSFNGSGMAPGSLRKANVSVTAPADALSGQILDLNVTAISEKDANATETLGIRIGVGRLFDIEILPPESMIHIDPGKDAKVPLIVRNKGNAREVLNASASSSLNWTCEFNVSGSSLGPGEEIVLDIIVSAPDDALEGEEAEFRIVLYSVPCPSETARAAFILKVNATAGLDVVLPNNLSGPPGEVIVFLASITNLGNGVDHLEFDIDPTEGWECSTPANISLGAFESREVEFTVIVPEKALAGTEVSFLVILTSSRDPGLILSGSFSIRVDAVYGLELDHISWNYEVIKGQVMEKYIEIQNNGNVPEFATLSVIGNGSLQVDLPDEGIEIAPFSSVTVIIYINTTGSDPGLYNILIEAEGQHVNATMTVIVMVMEFHHPISPQSDNLWFLAIIAILLLLTVMIATSFVLVRMIRSKRDVWDEPIEDGFDPEAEE